MTISSTVNRKEYTGNGVTTDFSFPYYVIDSADIKVYLAGVLQAITTHYNLSATLPQTAGVDIQFVTAPASAASVVILRDPSITQATDLVDNDALPAEEVEKTVDLLTMICQRLDERLDRSFVLPDTDVSGASTELPTPSADKFLAWNSTGDGLVNVAAIASTLAVTAFMETVLDDANAVAALATLGAPDLDATNTFTGANTFSGTLTLSGAVTLSDDITISGEILGANPFILQGATDHATNKTTVSVTDPTGARTLTIPDANVNLTAAVAADFDTGTDTEKRVTVSELRSSLITLGTMVDASSGSPTEIDFTSIPSWVKRITIMFDVVSTNGTSLPIVQIGDSGGIETSGYLGAGCSITTTSSASSNATDGFMFQSGLATHVFSGTMVLTLMDAATNLWIANGTYGRSNSAGGGFSGGKKALSAALDRVRITTQGGTDTFDAGNINIQYE